MIREHVYFENFEFASKMSNEDTPKRFGRFANLPTSVQKSDESGYAKKESDDPPKIVSGRDRMMADLAV